MSSLHNQIKYGTSLLRAFSRAVGLGEDEEGTVRLGETLTPTFDAWRLVDHAFLRGERIGAFANGQAAVAGEKAFIALCNPAGTRRITTVTSLLVRIEAAAIFSIGMIADATISAAEDSNGRMASRDPRNTLTLQTIFRRGAIAGGLGLTALEIARTDPNVPWRVHCAVPCVLTPGFGLVVEHTVDNATIAASWQFTERQALPGELP